MRDPSRIFDIMEELTKGWTQVPDWRFGQLIENLKRYIGTYDLFYIEDEDMIKYIKDYFNSSEGENLTKYYRIVPNGDTYKYIGYSNGEYVTYSKFDKLLDLSLIFKSTKECEEYIDKNLDKSVYKSEEIFLDEEFYKLK